MVWYACGLWFYAGQFGIYHHTITKNHIPNDVYKSWNIQPIVVGSKSDADSHGGADEVEENNSDDSDGDKFNNYLSSPMKVLEIVDNDNIPL